MTYYARTTDPETSHHAQDTITGIGDLHDHILTTLNLSGPLTDDRLVDEVNSLGFLWGWPQRTPQRIRTARNELVKTGRVEWTGQHGKSHNGGKSRTWRAI